MNGNRTSRMAADQQLADGLAKNAALIGVFVIGGQQVKPADVVQVLQSRVVNAKAVTAARANLTAAVKTAADGNASSRALIKAVKQALRLMFGNDINLLATFGLAPPKVHQPKPATKVVAAQKAKATRKARGTRDERKQKADIKAPADSNQAPATKAQA